MRRANVINLGFTPTDPKFFDLIKSYIHVPAKRFGRVLDPFAGEGDILAVLADHTGFTPYAIELDTERSKKLIERFGKSHVISGAAEHQKAISKNAFDLVWYNPPYGFDRDAQPGSSSQVITLLHNAWNWVAWNGYMIMCLNDNYAYNYRVWYSLADSNNIAFYNLGEYMDGRYHQVLVVVKKTLLTEPSSTTRKIVLDRIEKGNHFKSEPTIIGRTDYQGSARSFIFRADELLDEQRHAFTDHDFVLPPKPKTSEGKIYTTTGIRPTHTALITMSRPTPSTRSVDKHGRPVLFRAIERKEKYLISDEIQENGNRIQEYEIATTADYYMLSFDDDGNVVERSYDTPDARLEIAMQHGDTLVYGIQSITEAYWDKEKTYPWDEWIQKLRLKGTNGTQLKLYVPQMAGISAMIRAYETYQDYTHPNKNKVMVLGAEMGTGKTVMGLSAIVGIFKARPKNKKHMNMCIVMTPVTLSTTWVEEMERLELEGNPSPAVKWIGNNEPKGAKEKKFEQRIGNFVIAGQKCRVMFHSTASKSSAEDVIRFARLAQSDPETIYILMTTPETASSRPHTLLSYEVKPTTAVRTSKEVALSAPQIPGYKIKPEQLAEHNLVAAEPKRFCPDCGEIIDLSRYAHDNDKNRSSMYPKGVVKSDIPGPSVRGTCPTCRTPLWQDVTDKDIKTHKIPLNEILKMKIDVGKRRMPISSLLYLFYVDESHMFQSVDTARGVVGASIISLADYYIGASGTPMNGTASSMFNQLYSGMPALQKEFPRPGAVRLERKNRSLTYKQGYIEANIDQYRVWLYQTMMENRPSADPKATEQITRSIVDQLRMSGQLSDSMRNTLSTYALTPSAIESSFVKSCLRVIAHAKPTRHDPITGYIYGRLAPNSDKNTVISRRMIAGRTAPDAAYRFGTMSPKGGNVEIKDGKVTVFLSKNRDRKRLSGIFSNEFNAETVPAVRYGRTVARQVSSFNLVSFVSQMGVLKQTVIHNKKGVENNNTRSAKSQKRNEEGRASLSEASGLSPKFVTLLQQVAIFINSDDFNKVWPEIVEHVEIIDMGEEYENFIRSQIHKIEKASRSQNIPDPSLMGGVWQITSTIPTYPRRRELIKFDDPIYDSMGYAERNGCVVAVTDEWPPYTTIDENEMEYSPKERRMLEIIESLKENKGLMIFVEQTGDSGDSPGLPARILAVIEKHFGKGKNAKKKAFILSQSVSPDKRKEKIDDMWSKGYRIMIVNPALIAVGLSLTDWTSIIRLEVGSRLIVLQQATARARRAKSDADATVNVYTLAYARTEDEEAIRRFASKQAALALAVASNNVPIIPGSPGSLFNVVKNLESQLAKKIGDFRITNNSAFWYNSTNWHLMEKIIAERMARSLGKQNDEKFEKPLTEAIAKAEIQATPTLQLEIPTDISAIPSREVGDYRIGDAVLGIDRQYRECIYTAKDGNKLLVNGIHCLHGLYGQPIKNTNIQVRIDIPKKGKLPAYSQAGSVNTGTYVAWTYDLKLGYASRLYFTQSETGAYVLSDITHFKRQG